MADEGHHESAGDSGESTEGRSTPRLDKASSCPLADTLARVSAFHEYLAADLGSPVGSCWTAATELDAELPGWLERGGESLGTDDRRIPAALFIWRYAWRVAAPAIGCYLTERIVPDVAPENVSVRVDAAGVVEPITILKPRFAGLEASVPDARGSFEVSGTRDLRSWMHERVAAHMAVVISSLQACSPLGARAQWAASADACASAFLEVGKKLGQEGEASVEALAFFAASTSPLRSKASFLTLEHAGRGELFMRRGSCCLLYRLEKAEFCADCPLLDESTRESRLRDAMDSVADD